MSNKTPKKLPEETESAPKLSKAKKTLLFSLFALVFLLVLYSSIRILFVYVTADKLSAPDGVIQIEIADSPEERRLGLSGRSGNDNYSGMLFVFDDINKQNCFWMKDMKFSIDMVWMNAYGEVVTVSENIPPETYPETFCPDSDAKYGLEINSGNADKLQIVVGSKLRW
jgi:uncharacterized membrane protein (UPF0127 family)